MKNKKYKSFKWKSTAINSVLCLGSIAIFGLNPIVLCICYIGSDIALFAIDSVIEKHMVKKSLKEETCEELYDYVQDSGYKHYKLQPEAEALLTYLEKEHKKYRILQEETRIKEEELKRMELTSNIKGYKSVIDIVDSFLLFYEETLITKPESKIRGLKKIYKEFMKLKDNLDKKPEACSLVNGALPIYIEEIMKVITSYQSIPKDKKEEYELRYEKMCDEFLILLKNTNHDIDDFTVSDINVSLETLIKEFKEINKSKNE
ncbi:hypothetical protein [Hungatella hathewayi]|uniref:hypothetical protein n=1 Tax=Hungatella hathewayi TaxID=154046 RepID=UPI0035685369